MSVKFFLLFISLYFSYFCDVNRCLYMADGYLESRFDAYEKKKAEWKRKKKLGLLKKKKTSSDVNKTESNK